MKGITRSINLLSIILILIILSACSSGGGSSPPPPPPANTSVGGSVVKGIIKHALVEIFAIESGGVASQPSATTTTDTSGNYSFTLDPGFSGPVMVVVRDNNDPANPSTMTCDVAAGCGSFIFGDDMPLGNVELRAVVPNVTGGNSQTAAVTPFTHMAAAYAEQLSGGLTSDNIATANSKVGNMLGINSIVTTIPPDITNQPATTNSSFNEAKYAYLSAAIASLAQQQSYSGDISAVLDALVATYTSNGGELISAESSDNNSVISLAELAYHAMMQANLTHADSQVENALDSLNWIAQSSIDQPTSTTPSPTTGLGDVEVVKAFVADVRTWGNVIDQEVQNSTSEFQQRVDMAEITFDVASPLLTDAFEHAITAAFEAYVAGASANTDLASYFTPVDPLNPVTATGTITVTEGTTITTVTLNGQINSIDVSFVAHGTPLDSNGNLQGTNFELALSNLLVQNTSAIISAESGTVAVSYEMTVDLTPWLDGTLTTDFPDPASGTLNLTNVAITEIGVTDPVSYSGSLQAEIVGSRGNEQTVIRDMLGRVVQYNPASIDFTGELSNTANSITAHVAASMPNALTFMPLQQQLQPGYISSGMGSYAFSNNNNTLTITTPGLVRTFVYSPTDQTVTLTNAYDLSTPWNYVVAYNIATFNDYLISDDSFLVQDVYAWVEGEGEYIIYAPATWELTGGTMDGTLMWTDTAPEEDASNFRLLSDINVTFVAQLDGLPEARFEVTGNRNGFEAGDLNMVIAYGGRRIEVTGSVANSEATGTIEITNQDGVVITYERTDLGNQGAIFYNNQKYADIEEVNGITLIRYIDGYFDSL
ncbi:hypothetical protein [Kaarinaea lacus]